MEWRELTSVEDIDKVEDLSKQQPVLLFKHSTRCSISSMALSRLQDKWKDEVQIHPVFIDILRNRAVSNAVAERWNIVHQSPQALLLVNGQVVYDASHMAIRFDDIASMAG